MGRGPSIGFLVALLAAPGLASAQDGALRLRSSFRTPPVAIHSVHGQASEGPAPFAKQTAERNGPRLRAAEIALWSGIVSVAAASQLVGDPGPLTCGPCRRSDVPFFDRWAVSGIHDGWDIASTATLIGVAGVTSVLLGIDRELGLSHVRASVESAAAAFAVTVLLKNAAERNRPYTYTDDAVELQGHELAEARESWPSAHASVTFAMATSYLVSTRGRVSTTARVAVAAAATATGVMRVAAGWHFPSDVVTGAALGVGSALLVHRIRF